MKHFYHLFLLVALLALPTGLWAQGWPANYGGVMLQGFYWDSFNDSQWTKLEGQVNDFKGYFDLVWVPQSGKCQNSRSMGYDPYYYWNQNSSFGTEAQLRSMIKTFKDNGIGTIADVVINHRGTNGWFTFPAETYKGVTYQMLSTDICANDDGGAAKTEADKVGVSLSSNNDEGEDWDGMRDLDHKSSNVQKIVKAYEDYLVNDLGYVGFRYDMVKGFNGSHVGDYNKAAGVEYSVGEYWDGNATTVKSWIDATKINNVPYSAAFDFSFRYTVRDAINNGDWAKLGNTSIMSDVNYRRYAVTFVENHDTQYRSADNQQDPIRKDTLAANAFLLAMPGTPCVFYKHYLAYPTEIKAMIDARKLAGITNQSMSSNFRSNAKYYGNTIKVNGANRLLVYVGSGWTEPASNSWVKILSGYHYAYYLKPTCETAWADKPSGDYKDNFDVMLTAVSATSGAQLVYTLNGTDPTASSTKVASGSTVSIEKVEGATVTLKVGLLVNGTVEGIITRTYNFKAVEPETFEMPTAGYTFTAYFLAPDEWTDVYAWVWGTNKNYTGGSWPGDNEHVYKIGRASDGRAIWQWCYYGTDTTVPSNIIFNNGSSGVGSNQTVDLTFTNGGWYQLDGKTYSNSALSIGNVVVDVPATADDGWYTLSGIRMNAKPAQKGIYIHQGKKIVVK